MFRKAFFPSDDPVFPGPPMGGCASVFPPSSSFGLRCKCGMSSFTVRRRYRGIACRRASLILGVRAPRLPPKEATPFSSGLLPSPNRERISSTYKFPPILLSRAQPFPRLSHPANRFFIAVAPSGFSLRDRKSTFHFVPGTMPQSLFGEAATMTHLP